MTGTGNREKSIVLVGGGGHCRSCIDLLEQQGEFRIAGIVDKADKRGQRILGHRVFANDDELKTLAKDYRYFLITIGQIQSAEPRKRTFCLVRQHGGTLPVVRSPLAYVSRYAEIGQGTVIMPYAMVGPGAVIGENCIVNTRALVEHDVTVGNHCHLATGAIVNGGCRLEDEVFVGSGAVIRELVRIVRGAIVGCGVTVIRDITTEQEIVY